MNKTVISLAIFALSAFMTTSTAEAQKYVQVACDYSQLSNATSLNKFIKQASSSQYTPENRVIMLRNAMKYATTTSQRAKIIKAVGNTGTFEGLVYASSLLDDPAVKKEAANAVIKIGLAHPEYMGESNNAALRKSASIVTPGESKLKKTIDDRIEASTLGFVRIFNGKDLTGWKGLVENPIARAKMTAGEETKKQVDADNAMRRDWKVEDGSLVYVGNGFDNICTVNKYGDFEMYVDWKLDPNGKEPDAGIYLRGTPQVQIWDTARVNVGAQVGSGGLYNNQKHESKPSSVADNKLGEWNSFHIIMHGDQVTVYLNGVKVVDNVVMENYWDRNQKLPEFEQIELQAHGSRVFFRDIYVKRL